MTSWCLLMVHVLISITNGQSSQQCVAQEECQYQTITAAQIDCIGTRSCRGGTLTSNNGASGYIECSGYYSCSSQCSINRGEVSCTATSTIDAANKVLCSGYYSCSQAGSIDAKSITCGGSYSCYSHNAIFSPLTATNTITCGGHYSCDHTAIQAGKRVMCQGEGSCNKAVIIGGTTVNCDAEDACNSAKLNRQRKAACCAGYSSCLNGDINKAKEARFYGWQSGRMASITGVSTIKAYGYEALNSNTVIDSGTAGTMTVQAFGDSAISGSIICRVGAACTLLCKGTGCAGATYHCPTGATCNIAPSGCVFDNSVSTINGIDCPTFSDTINMDEIEAQMEKNRDNNEVDKWIPSLAQHDAIMADLTSRSCYEAESCKNIVINQDTDGYIYCYGAESCMNSEIIKATSVGVILCAGSSSCENAIMNDIGNSYLNCYGNRACFGVEITDGRGPICRSLNSCASMTTHGTGVACLGKLSCANANVDGDSDINGYSSMRISGWQGGSRAIFNVNRAWLEAYRSIYLGSIDCKGYSTLEVEVYAHLAGDGGSILCRSGTTCQVNCRTSGCKNMDYVCETGATCNVSPVECDGTRNIYQGIDCPTISSVVSVDEYMTKKYEMNKELYDAFDKYYQDILNDNYDDYDDEYEPEEFIFDRSAMILPQHVEKYNMVLMIGIGGVVFVTIITYLWCRVKYANTKEYQFEELW